MVQVEKSASPVFTRLLGRDPNKLEDALYIRGHSNDEPLVTIRDVAAYVRAQFPSWTPPSDKC